MNDLKSSRGRGEIARKGVAGHVGIAAGIHRDAKALIVADAAEVRGVDEPRARGIQLRHEDIALAAAEGGLERPSSRREIERFGEAGHVRIARGINGDRAAEVLGAAAEVRGVEQRGVDDERPAPVIGGHLEAHPTSALEHVATRDVPPDAVDLLIDDGLPLADRCSGRVQHEVTLRIDLQFVGAPKAEQDPLGIGARADDEVVLQLPLVAVVDKVDSGIDVLVLHLRIRRDIGPPLRGIVADEVVGLAG